jgi:hypothetical protein
MEWRVSLGVWPTSFDNNKQQQQSTPVATPTAAIINFNANSNAINSSNHSPGQMSPHNLARVGGGVRTPKLAEKNSIAE